MLQIYGPQGTTEDHTDPLLHFLWIKPMEPSVEGGTEGVQSVELVSEGYLQFTKDVLDFHC